MDSQTVQAIGVIAAAMVTMLGMLLAATAIVTKTVIQPVQQIQQWQRDTQRTLDGIRAAIAEARTEFNTGTAASRIRPLDARGERV